MHSFHHFIYLLSYTVLSGHTEPNIEISGYIIVVFFSILWYILQNMLRIDTFEHIRYFVLPAFTQYGNIWWVILVGITLFDDVFVT